MNINQKGKPVEEEQLFVYTGETHFTNQDRNDAIALLCKHLKVEIWRTNATEHGNTELELRKESE